ncbi:MAG: cytochrome c biogenesis protein CcsA [Candidatus Hydrogenedentes bacterium]|nr:cytochrome c biogenesis protein CcsA [Candidatus Hydrogenedentota bacterium]
MKYLHFTRSLMLMAAAAALVAVPAPAAEREPWSDEVIELFATLPVQDGGRIKPLDTFAQFTMLQLNGKRSFETPSGERLGPVPWLLDALFYPEIARDYKHFVVDDSEVVSAIGVEIHDKKRDRYAFSELEPGVEKLMSLAMEYNEIDSKKRDRIQQGVLNLANNVFVFQKKLRFLEFAEARYDVPGDDTLMGKAFPEEEGVPLSVALKRFTEVFNQLRAQRDAMDSAQLNREVAPLSRIMEEFDQTVMLAQGIPMFPPPQAEDKVWRTPADMAAGAVQEFDFNDEAAAMLSSLERLVSSRDDRAAFLAAVSDLHESVTRRAAERGEYNKIPLEVHYYKAKYIFYSQWLYVLSFLLVALSWLIPQSRWMPKVTAVGVAIPTILLIVGITLRCIIRDRPPITTLYETILFITACTVLVAMFLEWVNRQGISMAMGAFLGMAGMFLAYRYELKEGVDTMPSLVAVLDTNFWLATHVTIINVGYAAGMLSGALAHVYIFGKLFNFKKSDKEFYRTLTRMTYGVLCFGLVFSTVGTILGGIWANYSWGRFWGWDPKENGALMICLWSLVILHAKMGRHIKDLGIAQGSVILAMVVAFSWWGVNQLGVGLHSYGFTSGIMNALVVYWAIELITIAAGSWVWFREKDEAAARAATA